MKWYASIHQSHLPGSDAFEYDAVRSSTLVAANFSANLLFRFRAINFAFILSTHPAQNSVRRVKF